MIAGVEDVVREVAETVVMPRFRRLADHEVIEKGPGDLVTIADREAEEALTRRLAALVPGSRVVGEEAVAADASVVARLGDAGAVWVVDPVDGTANFAAGRAPFAVMVALVRDGVTVAGWIHDPLNGDMAVAERGGGTFVNGARVRASASVGAGAPLRGPAFTHNVPAPVRRRLVDVGAFGGQLLPGKFCAGYEYTAMVRGEQEFVFFWRTQPWDHAAGTLLVREAGGVAAWLDGGDYQVRREARARGLLVAVSPVAWQAVRATLFGGWSGAGESAE